jgi:AraC-like DNA-binding protein
LSNHGCGWRTGRRSNAVEALSGIQGVRATIIGLDSQPEAPVALNEIALRFGLSRSLLTREFRNYTNTSIVEYINIRRLQKAGIILSSTRKGIDEAAFESGFSSLPNFYRRFKRMYGVSPAEFRSQFFKKKLESDHIVIGHDDMAKMNQA